MVTRPLISSPLQQSHLDTPRLALRALWRRIQDHLTRIGRAHDARRAHDELPADVCRDTGLTAEDITGIARHQPDLPFFLQSGFGRDADPDGDNWSDRR